MLEVRGQALEEGVEAGQVLVQARRELVEQRAERFAEGRAKAMKLASGSSQSSSFFMWVMKRLTLTA